MKNLSIIIILFLSQMKLTGQEVKAVKSLSLGEIIEFNSQILEETRLIYIYVPDGLWGMDEDMSNLPVIFVLDGESQFQHTASTVDFLSSAPNGNDLIPRSIVVGIPNTNRNRDLTPIKGIIANDSTTLKVTGGGKKFLDFITDELIPYIDTNYPTSNHRTIIGHSLGGLIAFEALLRKREFFDNYIGIDPALGFADQIYKSEILDTLGSSNLSKENLFFAAAITKPTFLTKDEFLNDYSDFAKLIDIPNTEFLHDINRIQLSLNVSSKFYPDENHFSIPIKSTAEGLRQLYEYYPFPEILDYYHPTYNDRSDLITRLKEHYEMISTKLGYNINPMEGYINSFAFGLATSGREDLAIELFEYNIEIHSNNPIVYNNLGYYYMSRGNNIKALETYKKSAELKSDEWVLKTIEKLEKEKSEHNK